MNTSLFLIVALAVVVPLVYAQSVQDVIKEIVTGPDGKKYEKVTKFVPESTLKLLDDGAGAASGGAGSFAGGNGGAGNGGAGNGGRPSGGAGGNGGRPSGGAGGAGAGGPRPSGNGGARPSGGNGGKSGGGGGGGNAGLTCATSPDRHGSANALADNGDAYKIVREERSIDADGYHYLYETENGIVAQETGRTVNAGTDDESTEVVGFYEYYGDDGVKYCVDYTSDAEHGYVATAEHLPTPPPIPELIQRSLDYLASQGL